jgi:hypothetical protein
MGKTEHAPRNQIERQPSLLPPEWMSQEGGVTVLLTLWPSLGQELPSEAQSMLQEALERTTILFATVLANRDALWKHSGLDQATALTLLSDDMLTLTHVYRVMSGDIDALLGQQHMATETTPEPEEVLDARHFYAAYVFDQPQTRQRDIATTLQKAGELSYPVRYWWLSEAVNLEDSPDRLIVCVHHPASDENAGMDLFEALKAEGISWDDLEAANVEEYRQYGKPLAQLESITTSAGTRLFPPQTTEAETVSFESWMAEIDAAVQGLAGCSVYDLPDFNFQGHFEAGTSAIEAADDALFAAGFSRFE